MGPKLRDALTCTPPKLTLSYLPSHKPLAQESPWALTPPLHPMVSIPFQWEEAPGKPRPNSILSPLKPKSVRCLELPPRLLVEDNMSSSPTTVLDGPRLVKSLSHRFYVEGLGQESCTDLGLEENKIDGLGPGQGNGRRQFGPWRRWASGNGTKWNQKLDKGNYGFSDRVDSKYERDIEVKITRFRKKSKGSFYKLTHASSRVLENIVECLKQIVTRRPKQENSRSVE
ncbi:unnamed protein product [Amaranthus hypochondriacus]